MTILRFIVCGMFFILAMITDIRQRKIKNKLVLVFLCIGLIVNIVTLDYKIILTSIGTMLIPLVLLPLFSVRMIGAGDIKALCIAGLIMGWEYGIDVMLYSFVGAGVIALILMIFAKNGGTRFKRFFQYMSMSFLLKSFERYEVFDKSNKFFLFTYGLVAGWAIVFVKFLMTI